MIGAMQSPPATATVHVSGTDGTIRIERDALGIPRVVASSLRDLYFGQGYATAEDRLWHLEWDRRRAHGRLAAVTGDPGHVIGDAFARRARLGDVAAAGYAALSGEDRLALDAHAEGINAALRTAHAEGRLGRELEELGIEMAPWDPADAVAVFQIRHVLFATWQTKLFRARLLAALGPHAVTRFNREGSAGDTPLIVPSGVRGAVGALHEAGLLQQPAGDAALDALQPLGMQLSGSNCWVVHGRRTTSGLPIVAGDPHRAYEVPNVYYQVRLSCPSEGIEAAGFSFPGVPGIQHFGQTDRLAWGVTNAMADYQDLYVERLDRAILDTRHEVVEVAGAEPVEVECLLSRHGPIIIGDRAAGVGVALASTGLTEPDGSLRALVPLLRAGTVEEADRALASWTEPLNNWVLADGDGTIGYRTTGRIPIRTDINAWLPVPGWVDDHDWRGTIADGDLPRQRNPDNGAIVTANHRIAGHDLPLRLGTDYYGPSRAQRIWDRLGERDRFDAASLGATCGDVVSVAGRRVATMVDHPVLSGWDGAMTIDSAAAALYATARSELVGLVVDRLPAALRTNPFARWEPPATALPLAQRVDQALDGWIAAGDTTVLELAAHPTVSWPTLLAEAVARGEASLAERFGPDPAGWRWGELHAVTPLHPLRRRLGEAVRPSTGPIAGGSGCVMATNQLDGITSNALTGSVARYVWDLADPAASGWIVPLGAAGDPASPHFADQTERYAAVAFEPVQAPAVRVTELRVRS